MTDIFNSTEHKKNFPIRIEDFRGRQLLQQGKQGAGRAGGIFVSVGAILIGVSSFVHLLSKSL